MKLLILGSSGTVGKPLTNFLRKKNIECVEWDVKSNSDHDLRIKDNIDSIIRDIDIVVFLAFDVGGSKYQIDTIEYINNNVDLLRNTFNTIYKYNKKVIYFSSQMSNMTHNAYGILKRLGDFYSEACNGVNVKLWNVYDIEEIGEKSHVIPDFIDSAFKTGIIKMRTDGEEKRQMLYTDDFSEALYQIVINFDIFQKIKYVDITNYQWVKIYDIASLVKKYFKEKLNKNIEIIRSDKKDTMQVIMNEPTKSYLNEIWEPKLTLEEGIKIMIEKYVNLVN